MEKEFVPYELALKLKQLGFDEPCFAGYRDSEWIGTDGPNSRYFHSQLFSNHQFDEDQKECCSAPLFQQAFRWFREKYNLRQNIMDFIDNEAGNEWDYEVAAIGTELNEYGHYIPLIEYSTYDQNRKFKTYEEAELACLDKMIEIV